MAEAALLEPTDIAVDYEHLVTRLIRVMRASLLGTKLTWAPFRYTVVGNGFAGEGVRRCFGVRGGDISINVWLAWLYVAFRIAQHPRDLVDPFGGIQGGDSGRRPRAAGRLRRLGEQE